MARPILDMETLIASYKKEVGVRASCNTIVDVLFNLGKDKTFRPEEIDILAGTETLRSELSKVAAHFAPGKTLAEIAAIVLNARQKIVANP